MGQQSEITAKRADLGPDPAARRPRVGHRGDGRGRRPADRRLQHHLRDRARHDRREGPAGDRVVRGAGRDDVQVHEHRHALRADRRRRGDRLHRRPRRPRRARRTSRGWSATLYVALAVFILAVLLPVALHLPGPDPQVHQGGARSRRSSRSRRRRARRRCRARWKSLERLGVPRRIVVVRPAARLQLQPRRHDAVPVAGGGVRRAGGRRAADDRPADHDAADADADEQGRGRRAARVAGDPRRHARELRPAARRRDADPRRRRADGHGADDDQRDRQLPGDGGRRQVGRASSSRPATRSSQLAAARGEI